MTTSPVLVPVNEIRPLTERERTVLRLTLGARVAAARGVLKMSQRALAGVLGMSPSWIREVESGAQFAPWYLIVALSEATGWPVSRFCAFGISMQPDHQPIEEDPHG